jgi:hypothetical protein
MGSIRFRRGATLALALALAIGACSGTPAANTDNPAGTVSAAFSAAQSGGISKLSDFACAAHKNDIAAAFGGNLGGLALQGLKPEDLAGAMTMTFENVTTKEVSKTDTEAVVHVTADMKITIDKDKFKAVMKTIVAAQGLPVDDATIDAMLTPMAAQLAQTQKLDEDVTVVKEGGKWLLCE